jgi:imidazolonepropionase-like amidohydrolase
MLRAEPTTLANCRLFDGETWHGNAPHRNTIEDGRIASVEADRPAAPDAATIDLGGMTLMPGLIDAHFHCNSASLDPGKIDAMAPSHLAQFARQLLETALSAGFTTVRDAGGADPGLVLATDEGLIDGPRLFIAGKALSQTGGHGDFSSALTICDCSPYSGHLSQVVDGPDEVRRLVREHLRAGVHHIKIFVSGGVLSPSDPIWMDQFTDAEIVAAVEEAQRRRTYVMAHALSTNSIRRCAQLGVRSIEHGLGVDQAVAAEIVAAGAFVVPTLSAYDAMTKDDAPLPEWAIEKAKTIADQARQSVVTCAAEGVEMGFGTDLFGLLHGTESNELRLRAAIDGSLSALRSATAVNARMMMRGDDFGSVRVGRLADLIVVDGDPVADIGLLADGGSGIRAVLKGGRVVRGALPSYIESAGYEPA